MSITYAGALGPQATTPEGSLTANPGISVTAADGTQWLKATGTGNTGWRQIATLAPSPHYKWLTTGATGGLWLGTVGAGAGTFSTGLPTDTNLYTSIKRSRWANVVTTLNQVLGQRNTEARAKVTAG